MPHRAPILAAMLGILLALTGGVEAAVEAAPAGDTPAAQAQFFEREIRPLLVNRCYECHSAGAKKVKGGLLLDSREGVMRGGDSGAVIVPGDVERSPLIRAIRYVDADLQMPPKQRLSKREVDARVEWVRTGARDPRTGPAAAIAPS